jgi:plastocyanin
LIAFCLPFAWASSASAKQEVLKAARYDGMTTYSCRTDPITVHPGQNLNNFGPTKTCPNAETLKGPGDASIFDEGSSAEGYITRFKPSMVEIKPSGKLVTPSVWDLHLHHVVWIAPNGGPTFASGEEKTIPKLPQGYGYEVAADGDWLINEMIHNLGASGGRQVYLTWLVDWVPKTTPARTDIKAATVRWMDVAGAPHIYPVFDAKRGYDRDGDGKYTFPDEVPTDPSEPGFEERENISRSRKWTVPKSGATLLFGAGHLHPGGLRVDLKVARDGPDPGTTDGDDPSEVKRLFRSRAKYYEPAGAVSWDVALQATRPEWRIRLKRGDTVSISTTYNVKKASWFESMGILPLIWAKGDDPAAKDPFDDREAVTAMYKAGGILTHRRLPENIDRLANKNLGLPKPNKLPSGNPVDSSGIEISSFVYDQGGFSAVRDFPEKLMRPVTVKPGGTVSFTNLDAPEGRAQTEQVWHSITACKAPCNRDSGIGYPLADGPIDFDSGQLGYGTGTSTEVTAGTDEFTTPPLTKPGKTYTYFCRIHPFMRGSIRVKGKKKGNNGGKSSAPGHAAPGSDFSGALLTGG